MVHHTQALQETSISFFPHLLKSCVRQTYVSYMGTVKIYHFDFSISLLILLALSTWIVVAQIQYSLVLNERHVRKEGNGRTLGLPK